MERTTKRYHIEPVVEDDGDEQEVVVVQPLWPLIMLVVIPFVLTLGGAYLCSTWGVH